MSIQNPYDGSVFVSPEHQVGFGSAISTPAARLTNMVTNGIYYEEVSATGAEDVLLVNCENYLVSLYKSFTNQKLLQNFVFRATTIGGQQKIRLVHRTLSLSLSLGDALKSIGVNITVPDDFSGDMTAINQALAHTTFIQIFKTP